MKDVVCAGPCIQTSTIRRQGCQIDLLIHARNRVYVCECKLYAGAIDKSVIKETLDKILKLPKAKGISFHPVLIHANAVTESVVEEDYFAEIIDLGDGLFA